MELYQLKQFMSLVNTQNMRESAERLFLTQPAISKNIKKLEEELGCKLFERDHNKLKLNKYGKLLAGHSYTILNEIDAAKREIREELDRDRDFISCCGSSIPVLYFLTPCIANLVEEKTFICMCSDIPSCRKNFENGKYDFIFSDETYDQKEYESIKIFEEKLMLTMPQKNHVNEKNVPVSALSGFGAFYLPESAGYTEWFDRILDTAGVRREDRIYLPLDQYLNKKNDFDSCNLYSSFFEYFVPEVSGKTVYELEGEGTSRSIYLIYKKDCHGKLKAILEALEKHASTLFNQVSFASFFMFRNEQMNLIFK